WDAWAFAVNASAAFAFAPETCCIALYSALPRRRLVPTARTRPPRISQAVLPLRLTPVPLIRWPTFTPPSLRPLGLVPARRTFPRGAEHRHVVAVRPGRAALLRLAGALEQRLPAPGEPDRRLPAARRLDPVGALPHLQVGLGAVPQVVGELPAAEPLQVSEPVRVEAVLRDALGVVVEGALAGLGAIERHLAVERLERIRQRARARLHREPSEVGAVAPPERVGRGLRAVLLPFLDVLGGVGMPRPGDAAELPDPRPVARIHPAVRRDHAAVV